MLSPCLRSLLTLLPSKVWSPFWLFSQFWNCSWLVHPAYWRALMASITVSSTNQTFHVLLHSHWFSADLPRLSFWITDSVGPSGSVEEHEASLPNFPFHPVPSTLMCCFLRHLWTHQTLLSSLLSQGLSPLTRENFFPPPTKTNHPTRHYDVLSCHRPPLLHLYNAKQLQSPHGTLGRLKHVKCHMLER